MFRIELEKAVSVMEESIREIEGTCEIPIEEALGKVTQEDIYSSIYNPPFNKSPLDGYAVKHEDTKSASRENPVSLKVVDEVFAGGFSNITLKNGEAVRIMTGAKIPKGADAIIRQENTDEGMDNVSVYEELSQFSNYCFAGEDIKIGDLIIPKGETLTYVHIGILSSIGISKVKVKRNPKIALFVTGDEVQEGGMPLREGKIYDTNLHVLTARLKTLGLDVLFSKHIKDNAEIVAENIENVIDKVDFILTTGGVSVGKKDIFHEVIPILGAERLFWKVNLQPGTPAMFSMYKNKPILSLSGNPFASLATFELLGRPVLSKLTGREDLKTRKTKALLESSFNKKSKTRRFLRAFYEDGRVYLTSNKHASGMMSSMIGCNCLIDIEAGNMGLNKGEVVNIILI